MRPPRLSIADHEGRRRPRAAGANRRICEKWAPPIYAAARTALSQKRAPRSTR